MPEKELHPQEIVLGNARIIVHATPEERSRLFKQSLKYVIGHIKGKGKEEDYDFSKDINALIGVQIQLASLSLAIEYWVEKLRKGHIQVYNTQDMPKA